MKRKRYQLPIILQAKKTNTMFKTTNSSFSVKSGKSSGKSSGTSTERKFCGHCKKLGKSELEYTNHWPRESVKQGSLATCPEILKTECTYCHETGHWASEQYCPALKAAAYFKYEETQSAKRAKPSLPPPKTGIIASVSKFAILSMANSSSESESESDEVAAAMEEYPQLAPTKEMVGVGEGGAGGMSYRSAIMKSSAVIPTKMESMKCVRFEDSGSGSGPGPGSGSGSGPGPGPAVVPVAVPASRPFPLTPLPPIGKKLWRNNRFVLDWNASSSDEEENCNCNDGF